MKNEEIERFGSWVEVEGKLITKSPYGIFVRYEDHTKSLASKDKELEKLRTAMYLIAQRMPVNFDESYEAYAQSQQTGNPQDAMLQAADTAYAYCAKLAIEALAKAEPTPPGELK